MSEWIAVKSRLPEVGVHVLAHGPEVDVCEAYYAGGHPGHGWEQQIDERDEPTPLMEIVHWQPLPPPPGTPTDAAPGEAEREQLRDYNTLLEEGLWAAIDYINDTPCDNDITIRQHQAWKAYKRAMDRLDRARALRGDDGR